MLQVSNGAMAVGAMYVRDPHRMAPLSTAWRAVPTLQQLIFDAGDSQMCIHGARRSMNVAQ